jgi:hypothetical protein
VFLEDEVNESNQETIRKRKIRLKRRIKQNKQEILQEQMKDFYEDQPMNLSHIQLKKGVQAEEDMTEKKGNCHILFGIILRISSQIHFTKNSEK